MANQSHYDVRYASDIPKHSA